MGFRIRKSISLGKGLRLNLGKSGVTSVTMGKLSISLNPAEYMGISDPIDRVELAAYMRSAKRTIGKNIVLNFD